MSFSDYPACIATIRNGTDNDAISEATHIIVEVYEGEPGFCEYLLRYLEVATENPFDFQFTIQRITSVIKQYWDCENKFESKEEIRNAVVLLLEHSAGFSKVIKNEIIALIGVIASTDYPSHWKSLMPRLIGDLREADPESTEMILSVCCTIFRKYERSYRDYMTDLDYTLGFWIDEIFFLLKEKFFQWMQGDEPGMEMMERLYTLLFKVLYSLTLSGLPEGLMPQLEELFEIFKQFLSIPGAISVKVQLCNILKQYIIRYTREIQTWPQSGEVEEEVVARFRKLWEDNLDLLMHQPQIEGANQDLILAAFGALSGLARDKNYRDFFLSEERLRTVLEMVVPAIDLMDSDLDQFENDPLQYVMIDTEGNDSNVGTRIAARQLLGALCRGFREQLVEMVQTYCNELMTEYQRDVESNWRRLDTAIWVMQALAVAQRERFYGPVIKTHDQVDVSGFITNVILPQLDVTGHPVLISDALKLISDFRRVIPPEDLKAAWPIVVDLLDSEVPAVRFYACYCLKCLLEVNAIVPDVFSTRDVGKIVEALIGMLRFQLPGDTLVQYNELASECLVMMVTRGGESVSPFVNAVILPECFKCLEELCAGESQHTDFSHFLWECISGAVLKKQTAIWDIEQQVWRLAGLILSRNITDFIPYAFQIIACLLLNYPDGTEPSRIYSERFPDWLRQEWWFPKGNVPALVLLIESYCLKLPSLVCEAMPSLMEIADQVLHSAAAFPSGFSLIITIFRNIPLEHVAQYLSISVQIALKVFESENLSALYAQRFSMFMSQLCTYLEPDTVLSQCENLEAVISKWSEGLMGIYRLQFRELALFGTVQVLTRATVLSFELWTALFRGVVLMMESPLRQALDLEIQAMREQEEQAKEFDTTFSRLQYAGFSICKPPESLGRDLYAFLARGLFEYESHHPGMLMQAVEAVPEKNQFLTILKRYDQKYISAEQ